ncbi:MAG: UDP-N-acetylglucosamine--N-acetylmuramyl-(pentapeptide) pyrophosphoryl-undecaprenol N-acetylglucosamine transferase [Clostridia bacterium]|nr:UDP-N-acetylglucosamine--N-acetylmuramyl-(pentapeptide) pyrophosphoryl-undecaprenol N-acetylglucosamine transferase [Clostridia bacterium]
MEEELVAAAGYPITTLAVKGFSRRRLLSNFAALRLLMEAVREAHGLLTELQPDIVIGTGGYACYPMLSAAVKRKIPTAVHESNATPGLAVRWLSRSVDRVWLNFREAGRELPRGAKTLQVGNPVRAAGAARPAPLPVGCRRMLLSFGGSLGADCLNRAALSLMDKLALRPDIFYLHASGRRSFEEMWEEFVVRGYDRCPNLCLVPFISDMPSRMLAANLVICRAGAISISELAATRRPAVLIPSPNVTGNHQYKNARVLADAGAALLFTEAEAGEVGFASRVLELLEDEGRCSRLAQAIGQFDSPDAGRYILEDIQKLTKARK